jgi:F-type H+-transporting ATPase subunit delta
MRASKQTQHFARQLFSLSLAAGQVSAERVEGVLAYLSKHPPRQPLAVLRRYQRLVATQLAKNRALVEHAGPVEDSALRLLEAAFTRKYQRPVAADARPAPALIAGLRIRVGDDLYESSVASQLAALSTPA